MANLRDELIHSWSLFPKWTPANPYVEVNKKYQSPQLHEPIGLAPRNQTPTRYYTVSGVAASIFTRIAIDVASIRFQHVKIDSETETQMTMKNSSLNRIFEVEANVDQTAIDFMHELVYNMFDDGEVVAVPTSADVDPDTMAYDIQEIRIGKTIERYRDSIKVRLYNPERGDFSDVVVKKKFTAIIQNPLYAVLASGNPTLERLLRKLSLVDKEDIDTVMNKMNLILQLPVPVKGELKRSEAEARIKEIEDQLKTNSIGAAYIGTNEKITQLGREINSKLMDDIKYLTAELLNQLGLNEKVFNGTASAAEMQNYYVRTVEPIAMHIQQEFQRKFITKTGYTQGQRITIYMDPFKLVDISTLASSGDALIRNGIITSNEFRSKIGFGPHWAPQADMLYNPNIANKNQQGGYGYAEGQDPEMYSEYQNEGEFEDGSQPVDEEEQAY